MLKFLLIILTLFYSVESFADVTVLRFKSTGKILQMADKTLPGKMIEGFIGSSVNTADLEEVQMPRVQYESLWASQNPYASDLATAQSRRLAEIRIEAKNALQGMTGYALGGSAQRATLQASLRQSYLDAKTTVNTCADIACVRAVKPVWPNDPGE